MNARVDPATLPALAAGDDADLIARCKDAIQALEREIAVKAARADLEDRFYVSRPAYPECALGLDRSRGGRSASSLRQMRRELSPGLPPELALTVRRSLEQQITAVVAWERDCAKLRVSLGLPQAARRCKSATVRSLTLVRALSEIPARTTEGAGMKATVLAFWLDAGGGAEDIGEAIVGSIVGDVRRLGAAAGERHVVGGAPRRRTLQ